MKHWIVIDMAWNEIGIGGDLIPANCRPNCTYEDYEVAVNTMLNLQKKHPDRKYILFEAMGYARQGEVATEIYYFEEIEDE